MRVRAAPLTKLVPHHRPHGSPSSSGPGPGRRTHRGLVHPQLPRRLQFRRQAVDHRPQMERRLADPVGQRRPVQLDPEARVNLRLAVERKVVAVFRDQHMRQQALGGETALDQRRRSRRLDHPAALAPVAGIARTHRLDHQEPRRHNVEPFAAVLADLRHLAATAGADRALRLDYLHAALKPGRKPGPRPRRPPPPATGLGLLAPSVPIRLRIAASLRDRRPEIVERQLPLVLAQLLRLLAEQRLAKLVIEMLEPAKLLRDLRVRGLQPCGQGLRRLARRLRRSEARRSGLPPGACKSAPDRSRPTPARG